MSKIALNKENISVFRPHPQCVQQGCARFAEIWLKYFEFHILAYLILGRFSHFNIAITYSNSKFCGTWTPSFCEFTCNLSKTSTPQSSVTSWQSTTSVPGRCYYKHPASFDAKYVNNQRLITWSPPETLRQYKHCKQPASHNLVPSWDAVTVQTQRRCQQHMRPLLTSCRASD